jgi:hypothetical protein
VIRFFSRLSVFLLFLLIAQAIVSLSWERYPFSSEGKAILSINLPMGWRVWLPDPDEAALAPEIKSIQAQLIPHPRLGFLWKPNIDTEDNVIVQWGDTPAGALSTDEYGFVNAPDAIALKNANTPIDVIGIGASFMGGAQGLFHEYFWLKGLFYYNMAQSRFTLPNFNAAIKEYAIPARPRLIVYGLNEASFYMIDDFEQWRKSGMDWFSFHSGSWCGPAIKTGMPYAQLRLCRPVFALYVALERTLFKKTIDRPDEQRKRVLVEHTFRYITEAYETAGKNDIGFVVLFIPDKSRMIGGPSPNLFIFERIAPRLKEAGIPFIDLRDAFARAGDPRDLYFSIDNHWNRKGIYIAAREILKFASDHFAADNGGIK